MLPVHQGLEQLGHGQGLQLFIGFHQDGTVGTNGHGRAQGLLALGHAAGDSDHLGDHTLFLQAHGFFDGNLVKGVHAHLDVGDVHACAVGLHADFDVVVHHALDWDQYLHAAAPWESVRLQMVEIDVDVNCHAFYVALQQKTVQREPMQQLKKERSCHFMHASSCKQSYFTRTR